MDFPFFFGAAGAFADVGPAGDADCEEEDGAHDDQDQGGGEVEGVGLGVRGQVRIHPCLELVLCIIGGRFIVWGRAWLLGICTYISITICI